MAATYSSLEHIFQKPLPENPTLIESLSSWKQTKNPVHDSSFTEIFGELHYRESPVYHLAERDANGFSQYPNMKLQKQFSDGFSSMSSESLSLCTEELGSESSGDVEDFLSPGVCNEKQLLDHEERRTKVTTTNHCSESRRLRTSMREFPPPISCISKTGKPWVYFDTHRENGRFILKEIRIPTQEYLRVYRGDGRLKLTFVYSESDDDIEEGEEEEEEDYGSDEIGEDMIEVTSNIIHELSS